MEDALPKVEVKCTQSSPKCALVLLMVCTHVPLSGSGGNYSDNCGISVTSSLEPPREIPVYEILKLQDVFPIYSDQLPANLRS
jgi:hypothetical protein